MLIKRERKHSPIILIWILAMLVVQNVRYKPLANSMFARAAEIITGNFSSIKQMSEVVFHEAK